MTAALLVCAGVAGLYVLSCLYCAWANKHRCAWCGDHGPWVYAGTGERVCLPCDESAQAEEFPGGGVMMRGKTRPDATRDSAAVLAALGAVWSPDFDAYASGQLDASAVRCVLCGHAPCDCPPFGIPEYFALVDRRHGHTRRGGA